jgi:hypothetical protein
MRTILRNARSHRRGSCCEARANAAAVAIDGGSSGRAASCHGWHELCGNHLASEERGHDAAEERRRDYIGFVTEFKNGKAFRLRAYLDAEDALEALGLRE